MLREVRRLRARGLGIVLSTHDPDHAFACATAVALLHRGGLLAHGPPEAVLTPARLAAVYGVPVTVDRLPERPDRVRPGPRRSRAPAGELPRPLGG